MSEPQMRRCARTGLWLVPAAGEKGYRVARDRGDRGPLEGYPNEHVGLLPVGTLDKRGRFDTIGSTAYFADSEQCAHAEALFGFRQNLMKLGPLARLAGFDSPAEYAAAIVHDAQANEVDRPWAVSGDWQFQRSINIVRMPTDGWWVQVDDAETLTALGSALAGTFSQHGLDAPALTAGVIQGEERSITTLIAQYVRACRLDDESEPLGITFQSKTLYGRCWAYFDRRADLELAPGRNDPALLRSTNVDTAVFRRIAAELEMPVLVGRTGA